MIAYLESHGMGTQRRSLFFDRLPATPAVATLYVSDSIPIDSRDPASHPSFRILLRDTVVSSAAHRASLAMELLHHQTIPLPSYDTFVTANHEPGHYYNANEQPVFFIGFSTFGMVRRA